ncbi:MAG: SpoIIE family protein phosphatase [Planctomycetia bacterium]|nr:SpoIIE family protein phosphatase [Planctomycetia bacterium]
MANTRPPSVLRPVLVVQHDDDVRAAWVAALKSAGFAATAVKSVDNLWEPLRQKRGWQAMVVDLGFLDWTETEFLDQVRKEKLVLPALVTAWDPNLANARACLAYPGLVFRRAPLHPRDLVNAVRAFFPAAPGTSRKTKAPAVRPPSPEALFELELKQARAIQARLLPEKMPNPEGYEIAARYLPASHVGGDYYDAITLADGRVAILVADVAGKGIAAAMVMAIVRTVFHSVAPHVKDARGLVLEAAERISEVLPPGIFVSLAGAVLNPKTDEINVVNAGHLPPKHWAVMDGLPIVSDLDVSGGAIGLVKGASLEKSLKDFTLTLQQDEQLVFYTDGVNEAMDEQEEEFGDKNLRVAVKRHGGQSAEQMAHGILDSVLVHRGMAPASDDITILAVRRIC